MFTVSDDKFEQMIEDAIESIPDGLLDELDNIAFVMEDEPNPDQLEVSDGLYAQNGDLLGLYDGVSLLERAEGYGVSMYDMPDTITVFKAPHERMCDSAEDLAEEVRRTVIHEVGHYFGMDEEQVARMGYE